MWQFASCTPCEVEVPLATCTVAGNATRLCQINAADERGLVTNLNGSFLVRVEGAVGSAVNALLICLALFRCQPISNSGKQHDVVQLYAAGRLLVKLTLPSVSQSIAQGLRACRPPVNADLIKLPSNCWDDMLV